MAKAEASVEEFVGIIERGEVRLPEMQRRYISRSTRVRAEALPKMKGGLRALYRTLDLPGANPLADAHAVLDTAVLTAYGFNAKKDLLAQLLALNQEVAAKIEKSSPVTAPGVPKIYPHAKKLVTEDCIKPPTV